MTPDDDHLPAYAHPAAEVLRGLTVDPVHGLTATEATARLTQHGPNVLIEGRRRGPLRMFLDQFTDFMIVVLLVAAVVSGVIGDVTDTVVILVIVGLNAVIGFIQEYRAEAAIAALRQLAAPLARVLRDGRSHSIPAQELVPGDIVLLDAGAVVPADLRLLEVAALQTQEAALTGEAAAVRKSAEASIAHDAALGDRFTMAYKGTLVVHGRARAVVVATGMDTELGRIAQLLHTAEDVKTPLQKRLARFGKVLAIAVLALCAVIFIAGVQRGEPVLLMLLTAISLAVAAIPEALPAVVTVALALGARQMVRRQALIRKLPAVETLGSVTYICSDKTGTLTLNRMRVEELSVADGERRSPPLAMPDDPVLTELLTAMALNNDTHLDHAGAPVGEPTEVALFEAARDAGFEASELLEQRPRVAELPFDAARQCMTTLHRTRGIALAPASMQSSPATTREGEKDYIVAYTKGAPEKILSLCHGHYSPEGSRPMDRDAALEVAEHMATDGLRVLAYARRRFDAAPPIESGVVEAELDFLGLAGLLDPPRAEAATAIADCVSAGIVPVMITGDHPETARAIARRLGLLDERGEVLTGAELAKMPDAEFARHVRTVRVYARAAPEHKIRIVQALQAQGEFVAMTGDGVNDAPALKRADIGVAMGISGTDVAKEAAHMTLLDDNFATIVRAVREGRRVFDNIRKFIKYAMTGNSGEIWTIFLAPFLGLPIPLLPIHILWINLVTDGLPGLALSGEREERGIMQRPPRPPSESIFAHGMWQHILWVGLLIGATSIFTQAWALDNGHGHWQTMVFTVLTLSQLGHVLAIRSERDSLFTQGLWSNRPLTVALLFTFALQMATIYVPWLNPVFKTEPLSFDELTFCLAMSGVVFVGVEIEKWMIRHGWIYLTQT
jgi:Ca2+-transporting ATPase